MIYAATDIGYVSRQKLGMKMLASNFAGSKPGFRTEPLATSNVDVHDEPTIERLNDGYIQPTSNSEPSAIHHKQTPNAAAPPPVMGTTRDASLRHTSPVSRPSSRR